MSESKGGILIVEVVCDRSSIMANDEPSSPNVRVFMTKKNALWYEFEHSTSQQGSSSEGNRWVDVPSGRALSQARAGPRGRNTDEVDSMTLRSSTLKRLLTTLRKKCRTLGKACY